MGSRSKQLKENSDGEGYEFSAGSKQGRAIRVEISSSVWTIRVGPFPKDCNALLHEKNVTGERKKGFPERPIKKKYIFPGKEQSRGQEILNGPVLDEKEATVQTPKGSYADQQKNPPED